MILVMRDYEVLDGGSIRVRFESPNPAPYSHSEFYVNLTAAEATANQQTLRTTLTNRLTEKYGNPIALPDGTVRGQGVAALNTFKSSQITVT